MPLPIVFLPWAKSDLHLAADWYEMKQPGLGKQFKDEIIKVIDSIDNPLKGHGPAFLSLNRIFVRRFPYIVYFKIDAIRSRIVIYAILHEKQDKNFILKDRI